MTNRQLYELLAGRAETVGMPLQKALKRAARRALNWPVEAYALWQAGEPLQQLPGIGPTLERQLIHWFTNPPEESAVDPLRAHFLTMAEANALLQQAGEYWHARGDLQTHSRWSDGSDEVEDMADEARSLGYEYLAITDHAQGLKIAGGIGVEQLREQSLEIERYNRRCGDNFRLLRSLEVNLSPTGEPDMRPAELQDLDLVLGCFHSKLRVKEDQTERYLAALRQPCLDILGHPRGRIFNFRIGLSADWPTVFAEAARLDKAVEIDCFPDRQDLDVATLELARQAGVRISLGTDAHARWQLHFMPLGLAAAWKAGIHPDRILNFLPVEELLEWAPHRRQL